MVRTKVFVGNLSFTTKEPELGAAFATAGKVIGANIITRGPRSLGYGFVEMESEEDANNAVKLMNKKELNGRQINVEVAKPQDETKEKAPRQPREEGGAPRKSADGSAPPRRRPAYRRRKADGEEDGEEDKEYAEGEEEDGPRRRRSRNRKGRGAAPGQKRTTDAEKQESQSTLFVANLPFTLDDEGFAKIVGELGLKPKTAHVVKKRNGRSKGYGFVEFETEADQKKALDGLNKMTVEGRELSVKIALTEINLPEEAEGEDKKPNQPAAEKKTAPAEKKSSPAPAEKKAVPAEKKAAPAEKKAAPAEKKSSPAPAEKKAAPAEKKTTSPAPVEKKDAPAKDTKAPAEKKV
jgi:RNA recognition motif-containing protein